MAAFMHSSENVRTYNNNNNYISSENQNLGHSHNNIHDYNYIQHQSDNNNDYYNYQYQYQQQHQPQTLLRTPHFEPQPQAQPTTFFPPTPPYSDITNNNGYLEANIPIITHPIPEPLPLYLHHNHISASSSAPLLRLYFPQTYLLDLLRNEIYTHLYCSPSPLPPHLSFPTIAVLLTQRFPTTAAAIDQLEQRLWHMFSRSYATAPGLIRRNPERKFERAFQRGVVRACEEYWNGLMWWTFEVLPPATLTLGMIMPSSLETTCDPAKGALYDAIISEDPFLASLIVDPPDDEHHSNDSSRLLPASLNTPLSGTIGEDVSSVIDGGDQMSDLQSLDMASSGVAFSDDVNYNYDNDNDDKNVNNNNNNNKETLWDEWILDEKVDEMDMGMGMEIGLIVADKNDHLDNIIDNQNDDSNFAADNDDNRAQSEVQLEPRPRTVAEMEHEWEEMLRVEITRYLDSH